MSVDVRRTTSGGVAATLAEAAEPFVGGDLPVRLRAWDGSEAGFRSGYLDVQQLAFRREVTA